jgi:hypothetical protein
MKAGFLSRVRIKQAPFLSVIFIAAIIAFPRTFIELKLILLALIYIHFTAWAQKGAIPLSKPILGFYVAFIVVGLLGALVGTARGNPEQAISDGLRLYLFWSILIMSLLTYVRRFNAPLIIHYGVILAAFIISFVNIVLVVTAYRGQSVYPEWFVEAMLLRVGFHEGYVQIVSHNIGMLLFVVPYLLVTVLRTDGRPERRELVWLALVACVITALLSGRRALWLILALTPYLMWAMSIATGTVRRVKYYPVFATVAVAGLVVALVAPLVLLKAETLEYLARSFSAEDERTIQRQFLIDGFSNLPLFGSGFGGFAGYTRNLDRPWLYELSYHQMLFNFGLVGTAILGLALANTFLQAVSVIKARPTPMTAGAVAIMSGVTGILIGAYSNPYLGSFDFLVIIGFLPLIASSAVPIARKSEFPSLGRSGQRPMERA